MRRLLAALLCALLLAAGVSGAASGAAVDETWGISPLDRLPSERTQWWPEQALLVGARETAMDWLDTQQGGDGQWSEDFGVTGLVAFAMLNGGRDADHPAVAAALDIMLAEAREDGSFSEGTYVHYYTSVAVMALSAAAEPADEDLVRDGVSMLVRDQCDGDEEGFEEWWRGGIGYGGDGRPDMSNTQFALMALAAAEEAYPSIVIPTTTWQNALIFLYRCQNLPEVNDFEWADDRTNPSFDDGGFIYFPGRSNAGGLDSYGSMTAAGLWSLMAAGETTDSAGPAAALDWLGTNFDADQNPGFGDVAYYYHTWTLARALRTAGAPSLMSSQGSDLHWARELADVLLAKQNAVGSWHNTGSDSYWEGDPVVATCFALLAVEAMLPVEDAGLRIDPGEDGTVRVVDPLGRRDAEIPGWSQDADGTVTLDDASEGPFDIHVKGSDTVDVGTEVDGTVKVWKQIGVSSEGARLRIDLAPLLGPASLVINELNAVPEAASSSSPGAGIMMALAAVVVIAVVVSLLSRARPGEGR
ncbi:MAG: hypothetical protein GQ558_05010 [Thermoplasmata archaeon]|nr:hypothetical protein [Thermoplasmata archaeon]